VSLEVTQSNPAGKSQKGLKEFWKERFHPSTDKDKKGERDSEEEEERGKGREEEEEESKPLPVSGIGEDAFWVGNRVAGALYVLKNNAMVRISIGGRDEPQTKINKSKALAQKAIQRL
jgi:CO dehydrogenase/acetyl-CoA synthase beta subunit